MSHEEHPNVKMPMPMHEIPVYVHNDKIHTDWSVQAFKCTSRRYVHRAGRSARMGQAGEALLFLLPTEVDYLPLLARHGVKLNSLPLDSVLATLPNFATATVSPTSFELTGDVIMTQFRRHQPKEDKNSCAAYVSCRSDQIGQAWPNR
jgi:superfamily II DNA/RNA helicase